ncbi:aminotransferase class V-fold PLP-dependent enzyme [Salinibacterium sp. ZJ70]|uniref:aminotransferase class V-fold PLP-dependent enzyme n=1 Tax=Salinibacterium sp. ZJ70 TaxID=2708084 RepID=UPI0014214B8E|nr:aminotransferase class V-fold PLP-dependent enzyme [Salinibacterium sp. ZJ70]
MATQGSATGELSARSGGPARALWMLDPGVVHLNHGSYGAAPRATVDHRARLLAEVESNPLSWHTGLVPRLTVAKRQVAEFVGADPAELAFAATASAGTTAAIRGLLDGEVVLTDHAYGALAQHVHREASRVGVRVITAHIPLAANAADAAQAVNDAMTPATRLVVLDQVTSASARLLPVQAIADAAHERGARVVVDAAHAPGMLASPLIESADAWIGNLHKWACGVRGSAVVRLAPDVANRVRPPIESWGGDRFPESFDVQGSADATGWIATADGLGLLEELVGWDRIREYQQALVGVARDHIARAFAELTGEDHTVDVGMPAPAMALVGLPRGLDRAERAGELRQRIAEQLGFETQIAGWGGVARLRLSAHAYSTLSDFEAFAERAVPALVRWAAREGGR